MLPLRGVSNAQAVAETVAGIDDKTLVFLDLKAESDRLLGTYLHEALTLVARGQHRHCGLLSVSLRSPPPDRRGAAATGGRGDLHRRRCC